MIRRFLAGLAAALIAFAPATAADVKISALPSVSALVGTEALPCVQSGITSKCTPAQVATYIAGLTNTFTATQTINPAYAGSSGYALSNALCFNAPAAEIVAAQNCLGYGATYLDQGQLIIDTSASIGNGQNAVAIRQRNVNGFSTLTFQSPNTNSYVAADVYERGAIGYVPAFNNAAGAFIIEASTLPQAMTQATCSTVQGSPTLTCTTNAGVNTKPVWGPGQTWATVSSGGGSTSITMSANATSTTTNQTYNFGGSPLAPPPELALLQTGGVDTSGATQATCSTTGANTAMTCTSNGGANGQYVWGAGVTYGTTVSSGGGTTSLTLSQNANATKASQTYYFNTTPVLLQRRVLDATPLGTTNLRNFVNGVVLAVDRYNSRIGINTTTPAYRLDVNGTGHIADQAVFGGGTYSYPSWTTSGVGIIQTGTNYTDTTSSGTVTVETVNSLAASTVAASSATTITNLSTLYVVPPLAGTNVTATNRWAAHFNGNVLANFGQFGAGVNIFGGAATFNVNSNFVTNINTGTSTGAVNIGGGANIINVGSPMKLEQFAVSGLPTCNAGAKGELVQVTDATAPSWNATLTGGGAVFVNALCNGANWVAG